MIRFYFQVVLSLSSMVLKNSSCLTSSCGDTLPVCILSTNETNVAWCGVVSYQGKVLIGILDSIWDGFPTLEIDIECIYWITKGVV